MARAFSSRTGGRAGAIARARSSRSRGAACGIGAVIASISFFVRSLNSPGRSFPSSSGPMRTRTRRVTFRPTARHIRRTCRFQPVSRTSESRERPRERERTATRTARAKPSASGIPR